MERLRQLSFTDLNDVRECLDVDSMLQLLPEMDELSGEKRLEYMVRNNQTVVRERLSVVNPMMQRALKIPAPGLFDPDAILSG